MKSGRYSSPPTAEKLDESTDRLKARLNRLETHVKGEPLPAAVAIAALDLSDESRVAVCRELRLRLGQLPHEIYRYEAEAKGRLGR